MNNKKLMILISCITIMISCAEKVKLTSEELLWIDVYVEGDVLIFQNIDNLKKDTVTIVKKEVYHPKYDWIQNDKYQPQVARIWSKDENNQLSELLEIWKTNPDDKAFPSIKYKNSTFITRFSDFEMSHIQSIGNKSFESVYVFNKELNRHFNMEKHRNRPQSLYWDKEYGIIKYVTFNGEIWERINW
ncbi:hypothetical protein ABV409_15135 [Flagellimonas sp. DF-77]|uniref:hypothetical protein n=1 Tax=Flagellimonas algarum TaxID=3230298 RepID=UPI003398C62C